MAIQYVDPEVTKKKFQDELRAFEESEDEFRRLGIVCTERNAISISLIFCSPHLRPVGILFCVKIDYTNWDIEPPSVQFIDPFNREPLLRRDLSIKLIQVLPQVKSINGINPQQQMDLLQGLPDQPPFICMPGVKQYHDHLWHSGDSWWLYRNRGEGKLVTLIRQLYRHSILQINSYGIQLNVNINGYNYKIEQ